MININAFIAALKVTLIRRLILDDRKLANRSQISFNELVDVGDAYIINKITIILNPFMCFYTTNRNSRTSYVTFM